MVKLILFTALLLVGCLISGLYGALHDQISYSVSSDYFQVFKFPQFEIPDHLRNRLGASMVGWMASWWMGVFIGVPILLVGLGLPDTKTYVKQSLIAFAVVTATAMIVGLGALLYATLTITDANLPGYWYPYGVTDQVAFARVGTMHNYSYFGGFLGIITGSGYIVWQRMRLRRLAKSNDRTKAAV